ncbi:C45 family peptidase [Hyalangium rubrum]|uniref:C45 family peptidase n=1 Tax=Hyalangium rubrum TaxID=3103134 RepID=A0ABU5HDF4_9BACT|nr:C45 family peptidase [Hyalangium sp. s54d21]MDY7230847.1 C45 family peptidase [Hyalangium sp. s54d21]
MTTRKLQVVECQGTPRQIGQQWGEGCRASFRTSVDFLFQGLASGPFQASREDVLRTAMKLEGNVRAFDPDALELIRGQAEGAGIAYEEAFALQSMLEVSVNYLQIGGMCTSFAVSGKATSDGQALVGQNVDWHPDATVDLIRVRYPDGRTLLSLCLSCSPYYHLSSEGLASCANLTLVAPQPCRSIVPLGVYLPRALRQPGLHAALELLAGVARGFGAYLLGDSHGRVLGFESTYDDEAVLEPERDVLVHANHYQAERLRALDLTHQFVPCTHGRATRMRALIDAEHGRLTPERLMGFLADHGNPEGRLCRHDEPAAPGAMPMATKAAVVMAPARKTMWVAAGPACRESFAEYRL